METLHPHGDLSIINKDDNAVVILAERSGRAGRSEGVHGAVGPASPWQLRDLCSRRTGDADWLPGLLSVRVGARGIPVGSRGLPGLLPLRNLPLRSEETQP